MPYVPHTKADVESMLRTIGASNIEELFDEIPKGLADGRLDSVPSGSSELEMLQNLQGRSSLDDGNVCFIGAGCYDHHIPSAVWDIASRGEFMTAYTPYQAEASQGTLQLIYEYQTMMAQLTAMEVSNASVYDGASGLAEAILMAVRLNKRNKSGSVLFADSLNPAYLATVKTIVSSQGIELEALPVGEGGVLHTELPEGVAPAAVVIQHPNFFGRLESVDQITDWAQEIGAMVVAVVNPISLAVLKPPGLWGKNGADIACGDGQPLGVPMSSGGPSFGFICCKAKYVRQIPGRVVGKTEDLDGNPGYALTLQAREQHIRRGKATSNICTNQGLLVTAGTIYISIMGPQGLLETASKSHQNSNYLKKKLLAVPGVKELFPGPTFHEFAISVPVSPTALVDLMIEDQILAGLALDTDSEFQGDLSTGLLIAVTEKRTAEEIDAYVEAFSRAILRLSS